MFGETGRVNDEIHLRLLFVALPEAHRVVDQINACAAFANLVGANHFVEMHAHLGRGVGHGKAGEGGVFFQAAPVALVCESFTPRDAQRGEDAPAADQPGLAGRKADSPDRQQRVVMKDVRVNHSAIPLVNIVTESGPGMASMSYASGEGTGADILGRSFLRSRQSTNTQAHM